MSAIDVTASNGSNGANGVAAAQSGGQGNPGQSAIANNPGSLDDSNTSFAIGGNGGTGGNGQAAVYNAALQTYLSQGGAAGMGGTGGGAVRWGGDDVGRVAVDGEEVARAVGGNTAGHPKRLLAWLANHAAQRNRPLKAGDFITTGSHTGLHIAPLRAPVIARFAGLGESQLTLVG